MHTLNSVNSWLIELRPIMETLFFAATVALAVFAFKALEQVKISKDIARTSAKREAFKLAAEQCRYFAETVIPLSDKLHAQCAKLNLTSFSNPKFEVLDGEITFPNFPESSVLVDFQKCQYEMMTFLNSIEAFAVFFVSGVAEESVAYRETGTTFCVTMKKMMPAVYLYRKYGVRYESTVKLYEIWSARAASEELLKTKKSIDTELTKLKKGGITTIGTEGS